MVELISAEWTAVRNVSALALTNGMDENDCPPLARITTESISTRLSTLQLPHLNCSV